MNKLLTLLAAAWLLCLSLPAFASEPHVGLIKSVSGNVTITQSNTSRTATVGTTLYVDDRLVAAPGATAAIVFKDGTMLTLGSGADIVVRDYVFEPGDAKYAFSLYMSKGSAVYESGKIGKLAPEAVKVQTPNATVGVRGTRFLIEAE